MIYWLCLPCVYPLGHAAKVKWNVFWYKYTLFKHDEKCGSVAILFHMLLLYNIPQSSGASNVRACVAAKWRTFQYHPIV